jgi:hypothetical protein
MVAKKRHYRRARPTAEYRPGSADQPDEIRNLDIGMGIGTEVSSAHG